MNKYFNSITINCGKVVKYEPHLFKLFTCTHMLVKIVNAGSNLAKSHQVFDKERFSQLAFDLLELNSSLGAKFLQNLI